MHLEIITPDKKIFSGEITLIQVPGTKGSFEILKNHAPIISSLDKGKVKVVDSNDKEIFFDIDGGVLESVNNSITLLAEKA